MIRITGGIFKGREIKTVPDRRTRYTPSMVRQALFNILNVEGKSFLDLFCGSCAVLIEALSRGAKEGAAVDVSQRAIATCKRNLRELGIYEKVKIYKADASVFVKSRGESFDIIFMDPPYGLGLVQKVLKNMNPEILSKDGMLAVEASTKENFSIPDFLTIFKEKRYGDTKVVFLKRK